VLAPPGIGTAIAGSRCRRLRCGAT
jgi:hypothetical protein